MEISPTLTGPLPSNNSAGSDAATALSSDFETFLKMLTVQMQNQDPLDPVKSEDFAVQLATFSGVEQQVQTNDLLQALSTQMGVTGMAQVAGWVGMEARAEVAGYFDGNPITVVPTPSRTADTAMLAVHDKDGNLVQRLAIPTTSQPMEWSGIDDNGAPLPDGQYIFSVESYSDGALTATDPIEVYTTIVEARNDGGTSVLITEGGAEIPASAVTGLRDPGLII